MKKTLLSSDSTLIIFSYHEKYWEIARQYFDQAHQAELQREALVKTGVREFEQISTLLSYIKAIERSSLIAIVFAALAAETFINDYVIRRTSKSFFEKYLDRLDPIAKWIIVPRLVTGKQINTGCKAVELYKQLVTLRNRLVHWKTVAKPGSEVSDSDWIGEEQAELALSAVRAIAKELQTLDPEVDLKWLEESR